MIERRLAFVGNTHKDPTPFIKNSNLEYAGHLPNGETPRDKLLFLADAHSLTLEENGGQSKPLWVIDDRPEEFLKTAQTMLNDPNETSRKLIKSLCEKLILIKLETDQPSFTLDQKTGIRVAEIIGGQYVFPMHPTPNS